MGTIDKLWVKLTCETCGATETASALDKGSMWSGSHWLGLGGFSLFEVHTSGGGLKEPEVTTASCKKCRAPAGVEQAYGSRRPEGF